MALSLVDGIIVCYECQAAEQGRSEVEQHHVPPQGHRDDFIVAIPANDHRCLSDAQHEWPTGTLRNPEASPLLKAAAILRGWVDVVRLLIGKLAGIPDLLEWLDARLTEMHGVQWWTVVGEMP